MKNDVLIIHNADGSKTEVEHPFDALRACSLHGDKMAFTEEEIEEAKESIEIMTDEWIAAGNYSEQTVIDLRDKVKILESENDQLSALLAEKYEIYLDNCAKIDQLNIDLREVAPIIDLIIKHDKDAWPLAISWKRNYFRDIEFK
jgi:hypothetical protein